MRNFLSGNLSKIRAPNIDFPRRSLFRSNVQNLSTQRESAKDKKKKKKKKKIRKNPSLEWQIPSFQEKFKIYKNPKQMRTDKDRQGEVSGKYQGRLIYYNSLIISK